MRQKSRNNQYDYSNNDTNHEAHVHDDHLKAIHCYTLSQ